MGIPYTFYVVTKILETGEPVVDSCYAEVKYATKRYEHLMDLDGTTASVGPVTIDFYPAPKTYDDAEARAGWDYASKGIRTIGRGAELHNYAGPSRPISLPEVGKQVSQAWAAWRQQQADAGNLEEAGQDAPNVTRLFEDDGRQLSLFPRDLP